jgi:hypothetical protein
MNKESATRYGSGAYFINLSSLLRIFYSDIVKQHVGNYNFT